MKLLFFSPYFYPYTSGITTYPFTLFSQLAKKHEITVLTFPHKKDLKKEEKINGFMITRLPYLFTISKGFISPQSLWLFWKYAQKHDTIILNIPNFEGLPLAIIARLLGKKVISIFHCSVTLPPGVLNTIINLILNLSVYTQLFLSQTIVGYTDDYINQSLAGKLFKNKIKTHFPPVEQLPSSHKPLSAAGGHKPILIGYAGRVAREKGLEYLIASLTELSHTPLSAAGGYKLLIAGPYGNDVAGEKDYYHEILSQLKKTKLEYEFLGKLSGKDFANFYQSLSVLVLPSTNRTEAFGMVQIDAMLLGTPVIASDLPGVRVPVQQTKMGIIVEPKNVAQLSKAIQEISTNRERYTNPQLVKHTQAIFDVSKVYEFYEKEIL